ncbi:ubiquinol-cytochrome c reductase iron-sulfur subunit [Legionella cherrii]|uniref:Ubiquinol-cytochrome c reductase iron-sulfur subunit n=1 Tax=Legionella cherrii TaxID=28084 RepID=A0A0W0SFC4_9GAMM|nr:ubiquinol-cytochrome c reductase iron-sulfur subunit [Legionella cherrii]KTC82136.1 ubiquinol--cytochrome c reductase, iron-sulfur subunit [Legionella cherrii]VEB33197.1 ubiquinol--cytochrome c reductase, iron-sulfur subunit [Legionella cherrii]
MENQIIDPEQDKRDRVDEDRRRFLLTSTCVLGGIGALCALTPLVASWLPSAKAQAEGAPVQVDISKLEPGEQAVVEWRGKPVWIIRRTQEMLQRLTADSSKLRDPNSLTQQQPSYAKNEHRSIDPEYLVLIGICTHLGCSPKYKPNLGDLGPDWPGGFFCPCHGSTFDLSGRVFKDVPAPINLEVPPYYFLNKHTLVIGEDKA